MEECGLHYLTSQYTVLCKNKCEDMEYLNIYIKKKKKKPKHLLRLTLVIHCEIS